MRPSKRNFLATTLFTLVAMLILSIHSEAQNLKEKDVPGQVMAAFQKQFPDAVKVSWEKEKGDFEANWGGKSGEDHSALYTPAGQFVELVDAIPVGQLPPVIVQYVRDHYKGSGIREAGKVTDANGKQMFEAEIRGKDLIFDAEGRFLKED